MVSERVSPSGQVFACCLFPSSRLVCEQYRCFIPSNVCLLVCRDITGERNNQDIVGALDSMAQVL